MLAVACARCLGTSVGETDPARGKLTTEARLAATDSPTVRFSAGRAIGQLSRSVSNGGGLRREAPALHLIRGETAAMNDLSNEIRRRVQAARGLDKQQREEKQRQAQQQAELEEQRLARAGQLNGEVRQKMRDAAEASDGTMRYVPAMAEIGETSHFLEWRAPPPQRALKVTVNYQVGTIEWRWVQGGAQQGGQKEDVLTFDMTRLGALILALTDQAAWSQGSFPRVP